ncbi:N-formylglutamate amidohydrolase [Thermaurantiacus sp.]
MLPAFLRVEGRDCGLLLICDHASNAVPPGLDLGIPPALLATHIAWDLGAGALTKAIAAALDCPAILGRWSRLVVDCNRAPHSEALVPAASDGHAIPGNVGLSPEALGARRALHADFHEAIAGAIAGARPDLLVSIHSFTPALATDPCPRPWPVAVLWNADDRAARLALAHLEATAPGPVGANEPYSGQVLNYTMDRHAEAGGLPYIGFELRQDGLAGAGLAAWAARLAQTIAHVRARLAA